MDKLEYVGRRVPPLGDPDAVCNISIALLKPSSIARVDPENPCVRRPLSASIGVFDSELRFPYQKLAVGHAIHNVFALTRRRPAQRARSTSLV
jgi:hypothetical protein